MSVLDKDTLQLIHDTAVKAAGAPNEAAVLALPGEPKHVYGIISDDGDLTRFETAPEPRNHVLVTLDEVLRYAKYADGQPMSLTTRGPAGHIEGPVRQIERDADAEENRQTNGHALPDDDDPTQPDPIFGDTIVWYDRPAIVVVLDDLTRRDRATMKLNLTPQMLLLLKLEKDETKFEQAAFRRLLKIDLAGTLPDLVLLNWVSQVKFTNNATAAGNISKQRESFGRAVDDAAESDYGECPDEINLQIRVFDDPSLRGTWPVKCAVEVLPAERSFRLVPLALELHNAIEAELSVIGQHLTEGLDCPVFRGRP